MKVTLLNGAPHGENTIDHIAETISTTLTERARNVTAYTLRDHRISYCMGCFDCWVKTPGKCIIKDDNRDIAAEIITSDLLILISPITFGGFSSDMKRMLDHMIPLISPFFRRIDGETHHQTRYEKYPAMYGLGFLPGPNTTQEHIFHSLVRGNAINMGDAPHDSDVLYLTDPLSDLSQHIQRIENIFQEVEA